MSASVTATDKLEDLAREIYERRASVDASAGASVDALSREAHVDYLLSGLRTLPTGFTELDASRAWVVYWCVHGLALLGVDLPTRDATLASDCVRFLKSCRASDATGARTCFGFAGGPGQMPHVATTYAATCALMTIGTDDARSIIVKDDVYAFLLSLKDEASGGFRVHDGGESDVRGSYAALAVAHACGVLDENLTRGVGEFVARCQSYEGGIGGEPRGEAHGGYTFCGLAACALADAADALDLGNLERWLANRQGEVEGGFNGRTNKLVDGCYSFWQGGCFPLLDRCSEELLSQFIHRSGRAVSAAGESELEDNGRRGATQRPRSMGICAATVFPPDPSQISSPFASGALQGWILGCCQSENGAGGLRDKPGTGRDHYHTCYCLSGLSLAQHHGRCGAIEVLGPESNVLLNIEPVLNVVKHKYDAWMSHN